MELTPKQDRFCQYIARGSTGEQAYRAAFNCRPLTKPETCRSYASRLLSSESIVNRVEEYRAAVITAAVHDKKSPISDALQLLEIYAKIATADYSTATEQRVGCCRYCHGENHEYQWVEGEYMQRLATVEETNRNGGKLPVPDIAGGFDFDLTAAPSPDCPRCGGDGIPRVIIKATEDMSEGARLAFMGVKQTRNGIEVLMMDKAKALEGVGKILGAFSETRRVEMEPGAGIAAAVALAASGASAGTIAKTYADIMKGG